MRAQYSLLRRRTGKAGRAVYYVRFWNSYEKRYSVARSIRVLAEEAKVPIDEFNPFQRAGAVLVIARWLDWASVRTAVEPQRVTLIGDYLEAFWDWDRSDYIKGKLARKKDSIGKDYVQNSLSWLKRYVLPRLPRVSLPELKTAHLERLMLSLRAELKLSARTINSIFQTIRVPVTEAHRLGLIEKNPAMPIQPFGVEHTEKGILTTPEIEKLLSYAWPDKRIYGAFCLALVAGLRLGEIRALKPEAIMDESILVAHSYSKVVGQKGTKNNKSREVPVPKSVLAHLRNLVKATPHESSWVFWRTADTDKPMTDKQIEEGFYLALAGIGIPDDRGPNPNPDSRQGRNISFHSLRHGCNALLRGVLPDEKLRLVTGHSSVAMSNHYDSLTDQDRFLISRAQEERLFRRGSEQVILHHAPSPSKGAPRRQV